MKFLILFFLLLVACKVSETEPRILLGREWNESAKVVADTASQFKANDIIIIQMQNGKRFPVQEVELRVYLGETDKVLFRRSKAVRKNDAEVIFRGPEMTARNLLRTSTPGIYRIAVAAGDSIIVEKRMELIR
ncbi:MAG: hypothetical protein LBC85_05710 [Fibromonadaceae bacterium]|jgi:hypothetical protein|nr:hypothetical protein [Fibromonadaceae bacterium]